MMFGRQDFAEIIRQEIMAMTGYYRDNTTGFCGDNGTQDFAGRKI